MALTVDQKAEIRSRIMAIEAALLAEIGESGIEVSVGDAWAGSDERRIKQDSARCCIAIEPEEVGGGWVKHGVPNSSVIVMVRGDGVSRQNRFTVKKGEKVDAKKVVGRFLEKIDETLEKDRQYAAKRSADKDNESALAEAIKATGFVNEVTAGTVASARDGVFEIKLITRNPRKLIMWMAAITKGGQV